MQLQLVNRNYFNLLIAVGTVITLILLFNAFSPSGEDEKGSNVERFQEAQKMMNNFLIPPPKEDTGLKIAQPMPVIVTHVVVKTVDGPVIMVNKPIKEEKNKITEQELEEDEKPKPDVHVITKEVSLVKTVAVYVTEFVVGPKPEPLDKEK